MNNYWISWWHEPSFSPFELYSPWWISGEAHDGAQSICAAIKAIDEHDARCIVLNSYDSLPDKLRFRFNSYREKDWTPFSDRFQKADWMKWDNEPVTDETK